MKRPHLLPLFVMLGALAFSSQAMAHAHLEAATPADSAEVSTPKHIELDFSEGLELAFSSIELSDNSGNDVELGNATLKNDGTTLTVPITETLDPGQYEVQWQVLSVDGHRTEGSYHFNVTP